MHPLSAERAGPWDRVLANAIDFCLVSLPAALIQQVAVAWVSAAGVEPLPVRYGADLFRLLLPLAYTFYFETFRAGTPGKMFRGLVIARHDGAAADRWTLAFRWMTKHYATLWLLIGTSVILFQRGVGTLAGLLSSFFAGVLMVGYLQALDEDRRAWHDQWTGTAVWKKPRKPSLPERRPRPDWLPPEVEMQWPAQPGAR